MANKIKSRRGTAAQWTSANPTLLAGEIGIETDTRRMKVGDGTTTWTALAYFRDDGVDVGDITSAGLTAGRPLIVSGDGGVTTGVFGTGAGQFAEGNDSRMSNARTPTPHAASHAAGGSDPITVVNKVTITAPTTAATLTIHDGVTITAAANITTGPGGYITTGTGSFIILSDDARITLSAFGDITTGENGNISTGVGGSINTQGTGEINFGDDGTRTFLAGTATANRSISFPNKSGTLACTSDIATGTITPKTGDLDLSKVVSTANITEASGLPGITLTAGGGLGGTTTGSFILSNIGDPGGLDGAALEALDVGLWKYAGIGTFSRNLHYNNTLGRWDLGNTSYPACAVEVGQEGVTFHTAESGVASINTQSHEALQVRNAGVDTPTHSGTYYTGPTVQPKVPINFVFRNDAYASLGDAHPWQPGSTGNNDAPHIWFSDQSGSHECAVRADNSGTGNSGGQIFQFRKSRGTAAANSGDQAGFIDFYYKGTSAYLLANRIYSVVEAAPTSTAVASVYIGTPGALMRVHSSGVIALKAHTVATLPSASTLGAGAKSFVTDSTATHAAGIGTTVTGGGSNKVPVYSDGTNWIIG